MANLKDTIVLGKLNVTDQVTANKFIKLGGSSSQFLLANGDVTGIKTVNGSSIIGSGNITIEGSSEVAQNVINRNSVYGGRKPLLLGYNNYINNSLASCTNEVYASEDLIYDTVNKHFSIDGVPIPLMQDFIVSYDGIYEPALGTLNIVTAAELNDNSLGGIMEYFREYIFKMGTQNTHGPINTETSYPGYRGRFLINADGRSTNGFASDLLVGIGLRFGTAFDATTVDSFVVEVIGSREVAAECSMTMDIYETDGT